MCLLTHGRHTDLSFRLLPVRRQRHDLAESRAASRAPSLAVPRARSRAAAHHVDSLASRCRVSQREPPPWRRPPCRSFRWWRHGSASTSALEWWSPLGSCSISPDWQSSLHTPMRWIMHMYIHLKFITVFTVYSIHHTYIIHIDSNIVWQSKSLAKTHDDEM